jgi:hypothetical protein
MSEKHLTEAPWKTIASRQRVKDIGLQKSLAAYERIDAADFPFRALEMLDQISELALKLKKSCAAKPEVVNHLDEVLKQVKRPRPLWKPPPKHRPMRPKQPSERSGWVRMTTVMKRRKRRNLERTSRSKW